jgi:hypothetical protein
MPQRFDPEEFDDGPGVLWRWAPYAVLGALLLAGVWWLYTDITGVHGKHVEPPPTVVAQILPPPPPPPPPQPQPKPPEPQANPNPVPNPEPPKAPSAPAPMAINGPAQAGGDSFGLQSGNGGNGAPGGLGTCTGVNCGSVVGGGMSEGFYRRYLSNELQRRVQGDDRLNRQVFSADFAITIAQGRVTAASLVRSSGRDDRDQALRSVLLTVTNLDPPPNSVRFPQLITVRGRRSL